MFHFERIAGGSIWTDSIRETSIFRRTLSAFRISCAGVSSRKNYPWKVYRRFAPCRTAERECMERQTLSPFFPWSLLYSTQRSAMFELLPERLHSLFLFKGLLTVSDHEASCSRISPKNPNARRKKIQLAYD